MNIPNFKDQPEFAESATAADKCTKVDTQDPNKMAVGSEASLAAIVQSFIATQSQTNHRLIEYMEKLWQQGLTMLQLIIKHLTVTINNSFFLK